MNMRKCLFVPLMGVVVLGLSAYVGYRTYNAYEEKALENDLLLDNVEALAVEGESDSRLIVCYSRFTEKGSGINFVKDCTPCGIEVQCVSCSDDGKCRP